MKAAIIVDNGTVARWQQLALEEAADELDIRFILNCQNTNNQKRWFKHAAYYGLNLLSLRNSYTQRTTLRIEGARTINFDSFYEGAWQRIPEEVIRELHGIDVIIKFGMSLLRVNEGLNEHVILSFHHGDPEHYRGRPAGFYEINNNEDRIGIIVQKLSNRLDGGEVLARAHSKIHHHSYRKTACTFYRNSRFLLRKALRHYARNKTIPINDLGPNYRLPGNRIVLRFASKLLYRKIARLIYGAFFEKKWNIVTIPHPESLEGALTLNVASGRVPSVKRGFTFYADPFFSADGRRIRVEALNAKNGLGEIVELDVDSLESLRNMFRGAHYSYPFSFVDNSIEYIMPEVAAHAAPYLVKAVSADKPEPIEIPSVDELRLVDGTMIKHEGVYYLFAGAAQTASDKLELYWSRNLHGPYEPHPENPIVIDPKSARMGGRIVQGNNRLFRFGQNNCRDYGNGLTIQAIIKLTPTNYEEQTIGAIRFTDAKGPHTLDYYDKRAVLDFYLDSFSPLAGWRRLAAKL
jgi:hypothetical protein